MTNRLFQAVASISTNHWRPGKLARDTIVMSLGTGLRAVVQAAVFLIIARILGVEGYGAFVAVLSTASALSGLCGLGAHVLLVRDVARDPRSFPASWGLAVAALSSSIPIVFLLYLAISCAVLPQSIPFTVVLLLGASELILWPLANVAVFAYQGHERMGRASRMMLAPVVPRLGSALAFLLFAQWPLVEPLITWAALYTFAGFVAVWYVHHCVIRDIGKAVFPDRHQLLSYVQESVPFSFWAVAEKLYIDADKVMLARLASLGTAGVYSASYRLVDLTFLPLYALLNVAVPRFFRAGQNGVQTALNYALGISLAPLAYAFAVGVFLYFAAPLLPELLGGDYADTVSVARWLAWLPLITLPRLFLQYALATSDQQRTGALCIIMGAVVNIGLNITWIPGWGWRGAAAATYAAELLMSLVMFGAVLSSRPRPLLNCKE
ncbi:MAG: oligosaccharide flippase family protein [Methylococcales bacterium]